MSNPLPPTPTLSTPSPSTSLPTSPVSVAVPPAEQLNNTVVPPSSSNDSPTFGLPNPTVPGVMMSTVTTTTTVVQGIFGVGANFDPAIIVGLVLAGLIFLVLLGALIYCCCTHCCATTTTQHVIIKRSPSFQTIRHQERGPARPIYLTASLTPEYSSSADHPAASVFLQQPLNVTVGAYAAGYGGGGGGGGGGSGSMMVAGGSYPRRIHQQMIEPDVIITRAPEEHPVIMHTLSRKKYLYPADLVGVGNDVTYNTIRPTILSRSAPVITTLGDGYAIGHSLRSTGNRYGSGGGGRNFLVYQDDPSPQIITIY